MDTLQAQYDTHSTSVRRLVRSSVLMPMPVRSIRKSGLDEATEDIKAGRIYTAKNGEDLIRQCLE